MHIFPARMAKCLLKNIRKNAVWRNIFYDSPFCLSPFCPRTVVLTYIVFLGPIRIRGLGIERRRREGGWNRTMRDNLHSSLISEDTACSKRL
jgi:hypothetical protein